jgi:hypothetical protein
MCLIIFLFCLLPLESLLILKDPRSRGVLLALRSSASFYLGGKVVNVAGPGMEQFRSLSAFVLEKPLVAPD